VLPIKNVLKQGDTLLPWICNFALEHAFTRAQVNQDGLKLNGTHQFLVHVDDINLSDGSVYNKKKNTDALLVASKETGLEGNADKTKDMAMFRDQNAGGRHSFCGRVEQFRYLGTALINQNSIHEDIKSGLTPGNACYHSVQNLLSSNFLSNNIQIKIHRNIILSVVLYGFETWSLTLGEDRRLRVFENRVLRRILGPQREEVTGE
jgi:hypothetical protein